MKALIALAVLVTLVAGCGSGDETPASVDVPAAVADEEEVRRDDLGAFLVAGPLATVDGVEFERSDLDALHADVDRLRPDEVASSVYLLVLHEALTSRARTELDVQADPVEVEAEFAARTARYSLQDDLALALAAINETPRRVRINAELDALRSAVQSRLVQTEADGFDIGAAHRAYLMDEAEVCVQQMLFDSVDAHDEALARLAEGEDFATVARELSLDPFVGREAGEVGEGGDLGCSAPAALPVGLDAASLDAPLGESYGPVSARTGIHLLQVYDRTAPELDDVRDEVLVHAVPVQGPELFRLWAVEVLRSVEVQVDPDYGTWGALPETDGLPTVVAVDQVARIVPS